MWRAILLLCLVALVGALPPSPEQCETQWVGAVQAGNCSTKACTDDCLISLAQVSVGCVPTVVNRAYNATVVAGNAWDQVDSILQTCGFKLYVNETGSRIQTGTSISTIVDYLIGICVGAVGVSMVFIIFMAVPTLLSKTIDAPAVLVARGKQAYKDSGAAIKRGGQKAKEKAEELADELLHSNGRGRSKTAAAAPPSAAALAAMEAAEAPEGLLAAVPAPAGAAAGSGEEAQAEAAAGEAAEEAEPSAPSAAEPGKPLSPFKPSRHLHLVESTPEGGEQTGYLTWTLLALILFIAALALLVIGILQFVNNTVAGQALAGSNESVLYAIQWLLIALLIMVGINDIFAAWIIMSAHHPTYWIWRWQFKNYLYSKWVNRNAFRIHVIVAGIVTLDLTISMVLFGLGILIVTIQLVVQLACTQLDSLSIEGVRVASVCIDVPTVTETPMCGYDALQVCFDIQGMGVLTLVLGAALLLWSHIIWLVVLLLSMYRFMRWEVKLAPGASASTVSASAVSETDRSQLGGGEPAGGEAEQSGDEGATVGGAAAAAPSRPGLMRRLKFWGRPGA